MGSVVAQQGQLVSIPFRAQQVSCEASWASSIGASQDVELSCCLFGADGEVRGHVGPGQPAADLGAVQHQAGPEGGSQTVVIWPAKVDPRTEALLFVLAAVDSPVRVADLAAPSELMFKTLTAEVEGPAQELASCDLKPFVATGHQSIIIGAMYRTADGWVTSYSLAAQTRLGWERMPGTLRDCLGAMPGFNNKFRDSFDDDKLVPLLRRNEDRPLADWCCCYVTQLRVDLGWLANEGEEVEGQELEFNCVMYSAEGEEVQAVNSKSKDGEGVSAVPDEPEPEAAEATEEGEEGEEGAEKPAEATPAKPKDPFPLKDSFILTLASLPQGVCSMLITVNNFAGGGFANLKSASVRLSEITSGTPSALGTFTVASHEGADADKTSVVLCKLYKEPETSALSAISPLRFSLADLAGAADTRRDMCYLLHKQLGKAAAAKKAAELTEAGEEVPSDIQAQATGLFTWRLNVMGQMLAGASLEEMADELKRLAFYIGRTDSAGKRNDSFARAMYANGDTFLGQYVNDQRNGEGFYAIAAGGSYAGGFVHSKRSGQGVLVLPDNSLYIGGFGGDKFEGEGQYLYPDNSTYVGSWKAGKKHGQGVYWDSRGGCLRGTWEAGVLQGQGSYNVEAYQFSGQFTQGVPNGTCSFTMCAQRLISLPATACAHILADSGPTLTQTGSYGIPAGAADMPAEGEEASEDKPALPGFPKYEGLTYTSASNLPASVPDTPFPPLAAPQDIMAVQLPVQAAA